MGYLRFFYVEAKSFEIRSKICLGGRSRGNFQVVVLGRLSEHRLAEDFDGGFDKSRRFERVLSKRLSGKYSAYFAVVRKSSRKILRVIRIWWWKVT